MMDEISLENVIRRCGDFGLYQWIHFICLCILNFSNSLTGFYYVFGLAEPYFRCQLPSNIWPNDNQYKSINDTHQNLINNYLSSSSKCENLNGSLCTNFVYDRSVYGNTFTEVANLVCDNESKKTWLSTIYQIGTFSVLATGPISDRIGRRKLLIILSLTLYISTGITQVLLQFVKMSVNTKFIILMINQLFSGVDGYGIAFLLIMELTSSSHTSFAAGISLVAYTLGEVIFTAFAYAAKDWLNLKWLMSIYFAVTVPYLYYIPESPYWLFTRKKYAELENSLRTMAKLNRRQEIDWHPHYTALIQSPQVVKRTEKKEKKTIKQAFLRFLPRLLISGCIEFVTMLLYTKISYGLGEQNEAISPYTNFIIGAAVEGLGYFIASLAIVTPLGRKYSIIAFCILTAICMVTIPFIMNSYATVSTIVSQINKLAISAAVAVSWLYVPELFPTNMRGLANAIFVFIGSFGSIIAPIITAEIDDKHEKIVYYVYGGLTLALAALIITLPETKNRSFDDGDVPEDTPQIQNEDEQKF